MLASGLAWQQLLQADVYHDRERQQNERRILVPGPRGNIYDREGRLLVGNRPALRRRGLPRTSSAANSAASTSACARTTATSATRTSPTPASSSRLPASPSSKATSTRSSHAILGREEKVDSGNLVRHLSDAPLLPYVLIDDLKPEEYARLLQEAAARPRSPLQVYTSSTRYYPLQLGRRAHPRLRQHQRGLRPRRFSRRRAEDLHHERHHRPRRAGEAVSTTGSRARPAAPSGASIMPASRSTRPSSSACPCRAA